MQRSSTTVNAHSLSTTSCGPTALTVIAHAKSNGTPAPLAGYASIANTGLALDSTPYEAAPSVLGGIARVHAARCTAWYIRPRLAGDSAATRCALPRRGLSTLISPRISRDKTTERSECNMIGHWTVRCRHCHLPSACKRLEPVRFALHSRMRPEPQARRHAAVV
jgi:hypothetical protein